MTEENTEKQLEENIHQNEECLDGEEALNSDERCFRKKVKSRFRNVTTALTSMFRHIKEMKSVSQELSEGVLECQVDLDEHQEFINAIIDTLESLGMGLKFMEVRNKIAKRTIAPKDHCTETVSDYPKTWDSYDSRMSRTLFPNSAVHEIKKDEHYCDDCKFSQMNESRNKHITYECKLTTSEYYKYLTQPYHSRICKHFVADYEAHSVPDIKTIMIVDLTAEPEVSNYEI